MLKDARTITEKLNNTITLLAALVDKTGIFKKTIKLITGDGNDRRIAIIAVKIKKNIFLFFIKKSEYRERIIVDVPAKAFHSA